MNMSIARWDCGDGGTSPTGWWAVYTRHHHEEAVRRMLEAKGIEAFCPVFTQVRQWKDRNKALLMPLFPCYLFVRPPNVGKLPVVSTPGVHMIISHGERCALISDDDIETIKRAVNDPFRVEPHPYINCGERVRVVRGAMCGVEGLLVRKKSQFRLIVSVDLLNQSAAVEVNEADVEPCSPVILASGPWDSGQRRSGAFCVPA